MHKEEKSKKFMACPVPACHRGLVRDFKTGKHRNCTICHGTGKIPYNHRVVNKFGGSKKIVYS